MSIHVCKCIHNGTEEFHLRMPGVSESRVEAIASLINSGKLDQADWQTATSRQEAKITNLLNALQSLSRQVERMRESGVVWDDVGPEQMAIEAIEAAKETP